MYNACMQIHAVLVQEPCNKMLLPTPQVPNPQKFYFWVDSLSQ